LVKRHDNNLNSLKLSNKLEFSDCLRISFIGFDISELILSCKRYVRGSLRVQNIPYRSGRRTSIHDNWIFTIGSGFICAKGDNRGHEYANHGTKWGPI